MKKCFLFILFSILFSCNSSNENIKEIADSKKENNIPFYEINLSDTIEINTPTEFEIKLIYPNQKILSDYFSILILSDSTKVTFENLLERKDHPFEIEELDVNYWKAKRTFTKKRRLYTQRWDLCQRAIDYRYRRGFYWYFRRKDDNSH